MALEKENNNENMATYKTGEVARMAGVNKETIRYYERRGVIPQSEHRPAGISIKSGL